MHLGSCGFSALSMVTSPLARYFGLSKDFSEGTVISPDQKKLKKQRAAVAHIITMSWFVRYGDQCSFSLCKIVEVIGNHTLVDTWVLWIPD